MILIISGTNRLNSNSLKVAQYYQQELARRGQESTVLSLEVLPEGIIRSDLYGHRSEAFKAIQSQVSEAKKFIFIIPEYNGSFPGVLKVFIDACAFPASFSHKKAALVGISSGKYGNIRGVDHFTGVCNYMRLHVLPLKLHIPKIQTELDENQHLSQADTAQFVSEQIEEFIRY